MNPRRIAPLLLVALVALVPAREPQSPETTVRQVAEFMRKHADLHMRLTEATREARFEHELAQAKLRQLSQPYSADQVAALDRRIEEAKAYIETTRRNLAIATIQEPEARAARVEELQAELKKVREIIMAIHQDGMEEQKKLEEQQESFNKELKDLAGPVGRISPEIGITNVVSTAHAGKDLLWVTWRSGHNSVASLVVTLSSDRPPKGDDVVKLWGKYPILHDSDSLVRFQVAGMVASLSPVSPQWRDKDKLRELGEALVDFEVLERLPVAIEENVEMKRQINEWRVKTAELQARTMTALREPYSRQNKAQTRLRELANPYNPEQVAKLEAQLEVQETSLVRLENERSVAILEEPAKRDAARAREVEASKKAGRRVLEAGAACKAEQVALDREKRMLEFALWEMADPVVFTLEELGLVETRFSFEPEKALVGIAWRNIYDERQARAHLHFRGDIPDPSPEDKLAGKYPVDTSNDNTVRFFAGGVLVTFTVEEQAWQNVARVREMALSLLDAETIASWPMLESAK